MDPILVVVIILAIVGLVVGLVWWRKSRAALPPDVERPPQTARPEPEKRPAVPPPPTDDAKPKETKAAPVAEPAPAKPPQRVPAAAAPEPEPAPEPAAPTKTAPTKEDIRALRKGLKTTRGGFIARLAKLFGQKKEIDPALLDEIEEVLITADIGVGTTDKILSGLRERLEKNELEDEDRVWEAIREQALAILGDSGAAIPMTSAPTVIVVVGVNGVGKTTTIGKLASKLKDEGKSVILAAGDTFRAAAVLQLEVWGRRVGCTVVKGKERADPGSVIFDSIKKARDEGADVVIADTAGRLHTKTPLMEELKKVYRTAEKALDGRAPDEVLLVLDSTNGQNAIQQAQMFRDALPVSGIALTKLDGTAKGGVILGIVDEHAIPVRFIGIGERVEDLREFDAPSFVEALFAKPGDESIAA